MSTQFVDTNIFIRYLTQDNAEKYRACYQLFKRAEQNQVSLTTSESILAEVVYVLESKYYAVPRQQIKVALSRLLILPGLKVAHLSTYLRALALYGQRSIDFEDCLSIAHMERQKLGEIISYDRDFDQVKEIIRTEPGSGKLVDGAGTTEVHDNSS